MVQMESLINKIESYYYPLLKKKTASLSGKLLTNTNALIDIPTN